MITGYVRRQALAVSAPVLVADTIDYLTARFVFMTGDWDGLEVWAHFRQGDTAYDFRLDEDGEITADQHLNLTEGVWSVHLTGHLYSGGAMLQRISTQEAEVKVVKSGMVNANPFPSIPATVEEQIFAELSDHEERLSDIEQNGTGGGGGGTDITLGITGAVVGQTVKITEVDENGKPVKWEAADMESGGTSDAVQYVEQELTEERQMQARENLDIYRKTTEYPEIGNYSYVGWWDWLDGSPEVVTERTWVMAKTGGNTYTGMVEWCDDGVEHPETGDYTWIGFFGNSNLLPVGSGLLDDESYNTDMPFVVYWYSDGSTGEVTSGIAFDPDIGESACRFYDYGNPTEVYYPVPEEYIPDTIARQEDIPAQTDIDSTLSIEGAAADAKAVGDKVAELSAAIDAQKTNIESAGNEVYVLGDGETLDDAPESAKVVYDPNATTEEGEGGETEEGAAPDVSLGITGAAVDHVAQVAGVDEVGKPVSWKTVSVETIAQQAAGLIDTALLGIIGEVTQ